MAPKKEKLSKAKKPDKGKGKDQGSAANSQIYNQHYDPHLYQEYDQPYSHKQSVEFLLSETSPAGTLLSSPTNGFSMFPRNMENTSCNTNPERSSDSNLSLVLQDDYSPEESALLQSSPARTNDSQISVAGSHPSSRNPENVADMWNGPIYEGIMTYNHETMGDSELFKYMGGGHPPIGLLPPELILNSDEFRVGVEDSSAYMEQGGSNHPDLGSKFEYESARTEHGASSLDAKSSFHQQAFNKNKNNEQKKKKTCQKKTSQKK